MAAFDDIMKRHGWSVSKARGSGPIYELRTETTPYILFEPPRKHRNDFLEMVGVVGVIHRPFERHWAQLHRAGSYTDPLAMTLHLANFAELVESRLIDTSKLEQEITVFGDQLRALLASFPRDERSLRDAFERDELAGKPIVYFANVFERDKFNALKQFVCRIEH